MILFLEQGHFNLAYQHFSVNSELYQPYVDAKMLQKVKEKLYNLSSKFVFFKA